MTLGIIGGMGPSATAVLYDRITEMTDAAYDQDHMEIIIMSCPWIADRTSYILGRSKDNPAPQIGNVGRRLREAGAEILAIPCVTSHSFAEEIERTAGLPLIHMPDETACYLRKAGIQNAGIMATDGTLQSGIFDKSLRKCGITVTKPSEMDQPAVMDMIYRQVKAGKPVNMEQFYRVSDHLRKRGAEVVILGCTEFAVVMAREKPRGRFLSALDVLARSSVLRCGYPLRAEYQRLIE